MKVETLSLRTASRSQARSQRGQSPLPIPKVAQTIFRLIKLLVCKPKKCVSAIQRNCLKNFSRTWSKQYGLPIARD